MKKKWTTRIAGYCTRTTTVKSINMKVNFFLILLLLIQNGGRGDRSLIATGGLHRTLRTWSRVPHLYGSQPPPPGHWVTHTHTHTRGSRAVALLRGRRSALAFVYLSQVPRALPAPRRRAAESGCHQVATVFCPTPAEPGLLRKWNPGESHRDGSM